MPARRGTAGARRDDVEPGRQQYGEEVEALAVDLLNGDWVIFAGAGVSADALTKWSELIAMLGRALPELGGSGSTLDDFLDVAQWYVEEHGRDRGRERRPEAWSAVERGHEEDGSA